MYCEDSHAAFSTTFGRTLLYSRHLRVLLRTGPGSEPGASKNIDNLSAAELSDYVHALGIVKARRPSRRDSYAFFAALHNNNSVGPCEHARDTFLPWHRLHLLAFEDVLRASDPPRTANVTIPYWRLVAAAEWPALSGSVRDPTHAPALAQHHGHLQARRTSAVHTAAVSVV